MKKPGGKLRPAGAAWFVGKEALWLIVGERYDSRRRTRF